MIQSLATWFWRQLPKYFKINDTYKDAQGEGLLERYLKIYGIELDEEIIPYADGYISGNSTTNSIIDPLTCDEEYLIHIAYEMGNPPDLQISPDVYRSLLRYIVSFYKVKGTKTGYKIFFALLGYDVTVVEYDKQNYRYDSGVLYDSGHKYDEGCSYCGEYELVVTSYNIDCTSGQIEILELAVFELLQEAIAFNEPINAVLKAFVNKAPVCETFEACIEETIILRVIQVGKYDESHKYDDGIKYDTETIISEDTFTFDCSANSGNASLTLEDGSGYITLENNGLINLE